ncbi:unnamed protein product [Ceratitis capitata]|nr:unnamed protein product [Ceratitis capitata]
MKYLDLNLTIEEFCQERRMLLELVGPELQSIYDDRQIEIEIVDMHFGTGPLNIIQVEQDPYILKDYLHEIETCYNNSKSVFFLALIGDNIGPMPLPTHIDEDIYTAILQQTQTSDDERNLLQKWYIRAQGGGGGGVVGGEIDTKNANSSSSGSDQNTTVGTHIQYVLKQDYRSMLLEHWHEEYVKLHDVIERSLRCIKENTSQARADDFLQRVQNLRATQLEREVQRALELSNDKILAVFREWSSQLSTKNVEAGERLRKMKDELTMNLSSDNYTTLV